MAQILDNDKKSAELSCLKKTIEYIQTKSNQRVAKYINSVIPVGEIMDNVMLDEVPDFIVNTSKGIYAIEHFKTDFCNNGDKNNQSISQLSQKEMWDIYYKYHDEEEAIKDSDIEPATEDVKNFINKLNTTANAFEYKRFVEGFKKPYAKHYAKVDAYRENKHLQGKDVKFGFLIEFQCQTLGIRAKKHNMIKFFRHSGNIQFPLTKPIVDAFAAANALDFIILAQYEEGFMTESKSVLLFEPANIEESIRKQHLKVYDSVYFPKVGIKW